MSKIVLLLAVLFYFTGIVQAMTPANVENVQEAQTYGVARKNLSAGVLLSKWTIADSKKTNRFGIDERVIVYTPYAVAAVDAQNRAKSGQKVDVKDGLALAQAYDGILALGAIINSSFKVEPKSLTVHILQGKKSLSPYNITLDTASAHNLKISRDKLLFAGKFQNPTKKQDANADNKKKPNSLLTKDPAGIGAEEVVVQVWNMQYFIYFDLTQIDLTKPMLFTISDQASGDREFKINLMDMN
ncbi:MAG: hypothetical protein PHH31_04655 [Acidaminococcaceae bacterium]|nr:hypothetical protein [Acidaminococcaceae bacterium]MDD4721556.1 hypothetical protein [Acidaminococcaceae bacterium]